MNTIYLPAIIWIVGAGICYLIAKRKHIRTTLWWDVTFCLLGPLGIPIVLFAPPKKP